MRNIFSWKNSLTDSSTECFFIRKPVIIFSLGCLYEGNLIWNKKQISQISFWQTCFKSFLLFFWYIGAYLSVCVSFLSIFLALLIKLRLFNWFAVHSFPSFIPLFNMYLYFSQKIFLLARTASIAVFLRFNAYHPTSFIIRKFPSLSRFIWDSFLFFFNSPLNKKKETVSTSLYLKKKNKTTRPHPHHIFSPFSFYLFTTFHDSLNSSVAFTS